MILNVQSSSEMKKKKRNKKGKKKSKEKSRLAEQVKKVDSVAETSEDRKKRKYLASSETDNAIIDQSQDSQPPAKNAKPIVTFASLGLKEILCRACDSIKWSAPTPIQCESIPSALDGRDIIGVAETGSGKTGAFVLPVLDALLDTPTRLFCLVLAPTRELAFQIAETFEALGSIIDLKCATVVGGVDSMAQSIALAKKPHVVVATPGNFNAQLSLKF